MNKIEIIGWGIIALLIVITIVSIHGTAKIFEKAFNEKVDERVNQRLTYEKAKADIDAIEAELEENRMFREGTTVGYKKDEP